MVYFSTFDEFIEKFDVYKVETVADGYVVASGVPEKNGDLHASELAALALTIMEASNDLCLPGSSESLPIRMGINTG